MAADQVLHNLLIARARQWPRLEVVHHGPREGPTIEQRDEEDSKGSAAMSPLATMQQNVMSRLKSLEDKGQARVQPHLPRPSIQGTPGKQKHTHTHTHRNSENRNSETPEHCTVQSFRRMS